MTSIASKQMQEAAWLLQTAGKLRQLRALVHVALRITQCVE
ncbi:hypothetical protein [Thiothrix subterranea]|uniref:Uncharacterized protein n=1 Tax=Thiothrix subterranea TaxID=2735563 RepID=A0AA51MMG0_9GAMM|nr:hypothetical protein [Thiothrix subterranea]MDQ5770583.1 hypothetical protein [Thiothrix subterranea]WML86935.1 hypothetical protein RCG00_00920 [Thiothrix subterranea]